MSCPLCKREKRTKWYYADDKISVFDCERCKVPQWVWNEHKENLTKEQIEYGRGKCRKLFGENISFRGPRKILNHYHEHVYTITQK